MGKPIEATIMAEVTYVRQKANGAFSTAAEAHNDFVSDVTVDLTNYRNNNDGNDPLNFSTHAIGIVNGAITTETTFVNSTSYEIKFTYDTGFHPTYDPANVTAPQDAASGEFGYLIAQEGWTVTKKV